ncbi:hypothetical protein FACS1894191_4120 [Clostridia bacterium]|nr:hypothetical protein FACS1894191_4120 [Clostridia bacterium]
MGSGQTRFRKNQAQKMAIHGICDFASKHFWQLQNDCKHQRIHLQQPEVYQRFLESIGFAVRE